MAECTAAPVISERSRELAAANRSLPERVAALMRQKKAKLDKIRLEREQKETEETTFKPAINTGSNAYAGERVGHLMQYEVDRRIRAEQRKLLINEMEDRSLTFSPALNKNSMRIVERLKVSLASGAAVVDAPNSARASSRTAAGLGLKDQAGHEEETFRPRINARSKAMVKGHDTEPVYSRLYKPAPSTTDTTDADERSSQNYFNMIAYDGVTGRHDFILRRLLSAAGAANAML